MNAINQSLFKTEMEQEGCKTFIQIFLFTVIGLLTDEYCIKRQKVKHSQR